MRKVLSERRQEDRRGEEIRLEKESQFDFEHMGEVRGLCQGSDRWVRES